jgi:peptidyl-prolyl cis-trans isomerase C
MTFSYARLGAIALGISVMISQAHAADKDAVVAVVNGTEIHESQLREMMAQMPADAQGKVSLRQLTEGAVNRKLVADEARKEGLTKDPDLIKAMKSVEDDFLRQAWIKKHGNVPFTDDQMKKRYDELIVNYKPQEEVRAHHILVDSEDQAKAIIADLKNGGNFEEIAKAKSKDPTAQRNSGDLGFFGRAQMVQEFSDAAFGLKIGAVTDHPIKTQFGYHVIRLDEKRMSTVPPFADVKEEIRREMSQEVVQNAFKTLRDKAKVEIKVSDTAPAPAQ